jgi:hypothetical protein
MVAKANRPTVRAALTAIAMSLMPGRVSCRDQDGFAVHAADPLHTVRIGLMRGGCVVRGRDATRQSGPAYSAAMLNPALAKNSDDVVKNRPMLISVTFGTPVVVSGHVDTPDAVRLPSRRGDGGGSDVVRVAVA